MELSPARLAGTNEPVHPDTEVEIMSIQVRGRARGSQRRPGARPRTVYCQKIPACPAVLDRRP